MHRYPFSFLSSLVTERAAIIVRSATRPIERQHSQITPREFCHVNFYKKSTLFEEGCDFTIVAWLNSQEVAATPVSRRNEPVALRCDSSLN